MGVDGKMVASGKTTAGKMVASGKADGQVDGKMDGAMMDGRRMRLLSLSQLLSWTWIGPKALPGLVEVAPSP